MKSIMHLLCLAVFMAVAVSGRHLKDSNSSSLLDFSIPSHFHGGFTGAFSGDGTAYSDSVPNTGASFACSYRFLNNKFSQFFAAINQEQWDEGRSCGKCIVARCTDSMCTTNEPVKVQIVDLCPECKKGDVDFSFPAYKAVTGLWPHRLAITWDWEECGEDIDGTIRFDPKDGINSFWQAFYLSNTRFPIKSVKLNGAELSRSPFNFWIHPGSMPQGGCTLELTADNGSTVTAKIGDLTSQHDLGVQFPMQ